MATVGGAWKAKQAYSGAERWGTGVNPVHAITDVTGRNIAPAGSTQVLPQELSSYDEYGYCAEDSSSALWGYGFATGTESRPGLDADDERGTTLGFPPYAPPPGPPGSLTGTALRSLNKGADATGASKTGAAMPDAQQGYLQKAMTGVVEDAVVSDPSQYEMQTSMTQRDKIREGSQRDGGSASEYAAPVPSRRPTWAQRLYKPSGGERHYDMFPQQQDLILRPYRYRTAGVGPAAFTPIPEGMYQTTPLQRVPTANPDQGANVTQSTDGYMDETGSWY